MKQVANNNLKKSYDAWAITSIIKNTKKYDKTVIAWKIIAGEKITVEVIFHIIRIFRNEIVIKPIGSKAKATLGNLANGAQKLNFYLPDDMVLFQTEVKQIEVNGDIRVQIPEMMAQIDRRKHFRLFIQEGISTAVQFYKENHGPKIVKQMFKKECFDISAGGLSFVVSKMESAYFRVGDRVKDITLVIDQKQFNIKAEVINIFDIDPDSRNNLNYKAQKICFKYVALDKYIAKQIDDFVFKYIDVDEAV